MSTAIQVDDLGKSYVIKHRAREPYRTLRDSLFIGARDAVRTLMDQRPRGDDSETKEEFWALRNVCFKVGHGDRVGIIGRNGAGKSTLLKILSRITEPTRGRVAISGRVASLLEVGTGFHPELTGRENIYLNGAVLGMSRVEVARKFDEIVAFSEVERFLDTPVKRYSSGMYVRLAFAVAAHLEPEILIIDEVLAVGDVAFQRKCLGKMEDVSTKEGRTVLLVSHNMGTIRQFCNAAIMFDRGALVASGEVSEIVTRYFRTVTSGNETSAADVPEGRVQFTSWHIEGSRAGDNHACYSGESCRFVFRLVAKKAISNVRFGFFIQTASGLRAISGTSNLVNSAPLHVAPGIWEVSFTSRIPLKGDSYRVYINIKAGNEYISAWNAEPDFVVLPDSDQLLSDSGSGLVNEPVSFDMAAITR